MGVGETDMSKSEFMKNELLEALGELKILYNIEETKSNFCKMHSAARAIYNRDEWSRETFEKAFPDVPLDTLVDLSWTAYFPDERTQSEITNFKHKIQLESDIEFKYHEGIMEGASMNYFDGWDGVVDEFSLDGGGKHYFNSRFTIEVHRRDDDTFLDIYSPSGYHITNVLERLVQLRPARRSE